MRLNRVAAAVFLLPGAFAQKPPTPDAILVAGASPAVNRATDVVLNPRFLAVAPDGTLYLAARRNEGGFSWNTSGASTPPAPCPRFPAPGKPPPMHRPSSWPSPPMQAAICTFLGASSGS